MASFCHEVQFKGDLSKLAETYKVINDTEISDRLVKSSVNGTIKDFSIIIYSIPKIEEIESEKEYYSNGKIKSITTKRGEKTDKITYEIYYPFYTIETFKNDILHSFDDKPSFVQYDGEEIVSALWHFEGVNFRLNGGPAEENYFNHGSDISECKYRNKEGKIHRDGDLPAYCCYDNADDKIYLYEALYYIDGINRRLNKEYPACIYYDEDNNILEEIFNNDEGFKYKSVNYDYSNEVITSKTTFFN